MKDIKVYLEVGKKKVIAGALDWPGWQRIGRDESSALEALIEYGPRYQKLLPESLQFQLPNSTSQFIVAERLEGDATTDFGAPSIASARDTQQAETADLIFYETIFPAFWDAFDGAVAAARGKTLRKGPRGGGREIEGIMEHLLESDRSYLSALGWRFKRDKTADLSQSLADCRSAILEGLKAAVQGQIAPQGPRGGKRWPVGYYVRRATWHTVDHIWEIEDRSE